ncbi:unnamed protein product [Aphanomyces euteiches]
MRCIAILKSNQDDDNNVGSKREAACIFFQRDEDEEDEEADEGETQERPAKRQRREKPISDRTIEIPCSMTLKRADKINLTVLRATGNGEGWLAIEIAAARKLVKEKKHQDAFCVALAAFLSMNDYDMWFRDTEDCFVGSQGFKHL